MAAQLFEEQRLLACSSDPESSKGLLGDAGSRRQAIKPPPGLCQTLRRCRNKLGCQGETLRKEAKLTLHRKQHERPNSCCGFQGGEVQSGRWQRGGVARKEEVDLGQP